MDSNNTETFSDVPISQLNRDDLNRNYDADYKKRSEESSFLNKESLKKVFNILAKVLLIVLAACLMLLILARCWHLIASDCYSWLSDTKISQIDQLFTYILVGSVGSGVLKYFQKNIDIEN